jgi:hypothetical protein
MRSTRNSEEWLRLLCIEPLREDFAHGLEETVSRTIRIVDGTIVREPGKTGSQWRILYSIRLPSEVRYAARGETLRIAISPGWTFGLFGEKGF